MHHHPDSYQKCYSGSLGKKLISCHADTLGILQFVVSFVFTPAYWTPTPHLVHANECRLPLPSVVAIIPRTARRADVLMQLRGRVPHRADAFFEQTLRHSTVKYLLCDSQAEVDSRTANWAPPRSDKKRHTRIPSRIKEGGATGRPWP